MRSAWLSVALLLAGCPTKSNPLYCQTNNDCRDPSKPFCDVVRGECGTTMTTTDGMMSVGDLGMGDLAIPACSTSPECPSGMPICDGQMCRACSGAGDDTQCVTRGAATPRCADSGPNQGTCVACRASTQATDCTGTTPICGSDNTCRKCAAHSECGATGICIFDTVDAGKCAAATDIAFVDVGNSACSDLAHASTPSAPYCQIGAALLLSGKKYYRVAGSSTAYNGITLTSNIGSNIDVVIVGPGANATPPASIAQADTVGVTLTPTGGTLSAIFDGMVISGLANNASPNGFVCSSGVGVASITIRRSTLRASGATALVTTDCSLILTESTVWMSKIGATLTFGATRSYAISNNFFVANSDRGVALSGPGLGIFAFNTVARNGGSGNIKGAIDCGGDDRIIEASILANNAHATGGNMSSIAGSCSLIRTVAYTVDGTDPYPGSLPGPAAFESEDLNTPNFRLVTSDMTKLNMNKACCIDKLTTTVDGGLTAYPTRDVDGNPRPRGGKWDIGAHEAQ